MFREVVLAFVDVEIGVPVLVLGLLYKMVLFSHTQLVLITKKITCFFRVEFFFATVVNEKTRLKVFFSSLADG